jgi:hypothetical protein
MPQDAVLQLGPVALSAWDIALIAAVSLQATVLAYLPHPRWKAFMLSLPIPFTLSSLSLGVRVDITNEAGLLLLMGYTCAVYWLHRGLRVPIAAAIILSAAGYCAVSSAAAPLLPRTDAAFWALGAFVFVSGLALYRLMPPRDEPGHRSPLPVYIKLPIIALVILGLVVLKQRLQGFMTLFPMVGVVASYEGRHCLWTLCRQIPVIMVTILMMMVVMRLVYPVAGIGWALAGAWVALLATLIPTTLMDHKTNGRVQHQS